MSPQQGPAWRRIILNLPVFTVVAVLAAARPSLAQQPCPCPAEPPPGNWVGSAGLGFSLNRGNTNTTNVSLTFDATYDPKKKDVWKLQGLYLRGSTNGETSVDRLLLQGRYERNLSARTFAFGQLQYLRDQFKEIDYLLAPSGGIGYKLIATDAIALSADAGVGVKWEKNTGLDVDTSALVTAGDRLVWKVSPVATITQGVAALWNADDFGNALYTFSTGLATSVAKRIELKVELLDAYKTKPPNSLVKKNDVALLTAIVYKF
jgi:putative salt-induced outer membrane protein